MNAPVPSKAEIFAFCMAAKAGRSDTVLQLLKKFGAAIVNQKESGNESDEFGNTALMLSVWGEHPHIVRILLDSGANVDGKSGYGNQTPLMRAVIKGHCQIAALLLEKGASLEEKDNDGQTVETYAKSTNHYGIEAVLRDAREVRAKKMEELQQLQDIENEKFTQKQAEARLEELKKQRPPKPLLKKNQPKP